MRVGEKQRSLAPLPCYYCGPGRASKLRLVSWQARLPLHTHTLQAGASSPVTVNSNGKQRCCYRDPPCDALNVKVKELPTPTASADLEDDSDRLVLRPKHKKQQTHDNDRRSHTALNQERKENRPPLGEISACCPPAGALWKDR